MRDRLVRAGCISAYEEAAELLAAAGDDVALEAGLQRRERGEPLEWITGRMAFGGLELHIAPGVYVPRPQSEALVRRASSVLGAGRAADLCTGCGAIARSLSSANPGSTVIGVDIDSSAAACARRNGVSVVVGDLAESLGSGSFEVVTAVAPYVPTSDLAFLPADVIRFEPRVALDGGPDGLDLVRRIVVSASRILGPGGWLLLELGGHQDVLLGPALSQAGFHDVGTWVDDHGDLRGLMAQLR